MIKLRLAVLDSDRTYLERIVGVFLNKFNDRLEVYSFTEVSSAMNALSVNKIDVFLSSEEFAIDISKIPSRCAFAYFTESNAVDTIYDQKAICKFQKVELLYKELISLFSEKSAKMVGFKTEENDDITIMTFLSSSGGTGSSSMAAACAMNLAKIDKKVLYLNIEYFGTAQTYFQDEGQSNLGDVIYAIKSGKNNLSLKLESAVKHDTNKGVFFYDSCKIPLEVMEISDQDIKKLIEELKILGKYDRIIIDCDYILNKTLMTVMEYSKYLIFVSDGSEIANMKFQKSYEAMEVLEVQHDTPLLSKINIIYNKFSSKTGKQIQMEGVKSIGGAPKYEQATTEQVIQQLSKMDLFAGLV